MNGKPSLFLELRRRNVFRVALTYAVVAWLLIEIAAVFLPMLDAPEWMITAFVVLLALGFAVALFISWSFEMTPEGLKRTEDLSPDEVIPYWSRRKFARFIIGVAVIAFGLSAYQLLVPKRAATFSKNEPGSISAQAAAGSPSENASSTEPVERILRDLDAQWSNAAAAKNLEQTIAYYSDDATVLPPNATSASTKEAIRNVWKDLLASPGLVITWKPTRVELSKSDDMACVSGMYELTMNDAAGRSINDRGKYVEVWKKQPDGNWKCGADMWNSDLPVQAQATTEKK
jgi:ketosteroid isomerase-like protein